MTKRLVFLIVAAFTFFLLPSPVQAASKSFSFPSVDISAKINSDGSVDFVERRETSFSGSFSRIYWDIPLSSEQTMTSIAASEERAGE